MFFRVPLAVRTASVCASQFAAQEEEALTKPRLPHGEVLKCLKYRVGQGACPGLVRGIKPLAAKPAAGGKRYDTQYGAR